MWPYHIILVEGAYEWEIFVCIQFQKRAKWQRKYCQEITRNKDSLVDNFTKKEGYIEEGGENVFGFFPLKKKDYL